MSRDHLSLCKHNFIIKTVALLTSLLSISMGKSFRNAWRGQSS